MAYVPCGRVNLGVRCKGGFVLRKCIGVLFLVMLTAFSASADSTRYFTMGTARARALAMAGAYYSVEDDFSAGFYNPGAFKIHATKNERRIKLFFNPVASLTAFKDYSDYDYDYSRDGELTFEEALVSLSMAIKGLTFTTTYLDFGIGLGEEIIGGSAASMKTAGELLSFEGMNSGAFHSAFVNMKIAPAVSIGLAGTLYSHGFDDSNDLDSGYTFGVQLAPNPKLNVGIVYTEIPEDFENARMGLESVESNSAISGLTYHPDEKTILSFDLRSVNKEDNDTSRQIHMGFERTFYERISFRAGYYREKATDHNIYSAGIGLLPRWEKIKKFSGTTRNDILSYAFILEENSYSRRWHVLSLLLRM